MSTLPSLPAIALGISPTHDLLNQAIQACNLRNAAEALFLLERLKQVFPPIGEKRLKTLASLVEARAHFQNDDMPLAQEAILLVDMAILLDDLRLQGIYYSIAGHCKRRLALAARAQGDRGAALMYAEWAIGNFQRAARCSADDPLMARNARLMDIYTAGLKSSILGRLASDNPRLFIDAVIAVRDIRHASSHLNRNPIVDLTIMADIAWGFGLAAHQMESLEPSALEFHGARLEVFTALPASWPVQLLLTARDNRQPPSSRGRGLLLGKAMLDTPEYLEHRGELATDYQYQLEDVYQTLRSTNLWRNTKLMAQINEAINALAHVSGRNLKGRRAFR